MNILIVVVDSLRADHLSCYGYQRDTSPHLEALAAQGMVFENMFTPAIPTQPSFASFYTGQHPLTHGIVSHGGQAVLSPDRPWLTEQLQQAGFVTAAVDNLYSLRHWYARGYEFYIDPTHRPGRRPSASGENLNQRALPWLRAHAREQFFLLVHYWDTHTAYRPPARLRHRYYPGDPTEERFTSLQAMPSAPLGDVWSEQWLGPLSRRLFSGRPLRDAEYVVALYDACIRYVDEQIGALLSALEDSGAADDTLVIIMADHGEMLYRHGIFFDHHGLYDPNLRLPFIVRWPGRTPAGARCPGQVHSIDLAPTLLAIARAPIPEAMEGTSFLPALLGEPGWQPRDRLIAEECTWQAKWCLRRDGRKLILARAPDLYGRPARELYDLQADPGELHNLAAEQPQIAAAMEEELEAWIAARLAALGLDTDPLLAQGITLGQAWQEEQERKGTRP
jgi:arylsulfatase A-like enzyme